MIETEQQQERRERNALHLPPIKLHTYEVEGALGGHVWSKPFDAYIGHIVPTETRIERDQWDQWWRIPYVVDTLKEALGEVVVEALEEWLSDADMYHATCRRYGLRYRDLQTFYIKAKRIVRGLRPEMPRTWVA